MQKHVNLVDLVTSFPTHIFLQNLASIQKRTSPRKFDTLAEKSDEGSTSNLSTKARSGGGIGGRGVLLAHDLPALAQRGGRRGPRAGGPLRALGALRRAPGAGAGAPAPARRRLRLRPPGLRTPLNNIE